LNVLILKNPKEIMNRFIIRAFVALAVVIASIAADAAEVTNQVKIADVPAAVQKTIHAQVARAD